MDLHEQELGSSFEEKNSLASKLLQIFSIDDERMLIIVLLVGFYSRTELSVLLQGAVLQNATKCVKELLLRGALPDRILPNGTIPLHSAFAFSTLEIVQILWEQSFFRRRPNQKGENVLVLALQRGDEDMIRFLFEQGIKLEEVPSSYCPLSMVMRKEATSSLVAHLLSSGASVNKVAKGSTPLDLACLLDRHGLAKLIFSFGGKLGSSLRRRGTTHLHFAVAKGNSKIVDFLLKNRLVSFDQVDKNNRTAWFRVLFLNTPRVHEILETFLRRGANPDQLFANCHNSPLMLACNDLIATRTLLRYGANVNQKGRDNMTPLHCAVLSRNIPVAKALLSFRPSRNKKNIYGETPYQLAIKMKQREMADLILSN